MRHIFLLLLIGASVGVFLAIIKPRYDELQMVKSDVASYEANLETAAKLKQSREELIAKYNSIQKSDLDGLRALLPDSVDNIRLIIQLDALATRNGLSKLRNVDYQVMDAKADSQQNSQNPELAKKPYGEFVISFQTVGQYQNFLSFISDLEKNLRLVDVTAVEFGVNAPGAGSQSGQAASSHIYKVTLKTYWLKQ